MRKDGRRTSQLRPVTFETKVQKDPQGSVMVRFGDTVVLCAATVSTKVPDWLAGKGRGWITAEYSMLPGSGAGRVPRVQKGRSEEIQRLIGRSLRASCDLEALGERLITVDCDVIQADGGTRCASITGGWVALELAMRRLTADGLIPKSALIRRVCAVSCAVTNGVALLDPNYEEDSSADVDMNFVFADDGRLVEIQGTAEGQPFAHSTLNALLDLAWAGAKELFDLQLRSSTTVSQTITSRNPR